MISPASFRSYLILRSNNATNPAHLCNLWCPIFCSWNAGVELEYKHEFICCNILPVFWVASHFCVTYWTVTIHKCIDILHNLYLHLFVQCVYVFMLFCLLNQSRQVWGKNRVLLFQKDNKCVFIVGKKVFIEAHIRPRGGRVFSVFCPGIKFWHQIQRGIN